MCVLTHWKYLIAIDTWNESIDLASSLKVGALIQSVNCKLIWHVRVRNLAELQKMGHCEKWDSCLPSCSQRIWFIISWACYVRFNDLLTVFEWSVVGFAQWQSVRIYPQCNTQTHYVIVPMLGGCWFQQKSWFKILEFSVVVNKKWKCWILDHSVQKHYGKTSMHCSCR